MVVRMHRSLAAKRLARELSAAIGDHFVYVHVVLGTTTPHPHMQRKHVVMLTGEDFVASLNDQRVLLITEPLTGMVCYGHGFLQNGISGDHLAGNQILADAEMLQRALCLGPPQTISRHLDLP